MPVSQQRVRTRIHLTPMALMLLSLPPFAPSPPLRRSQLPASSFPRVYLRTTLDCASPRSSTIRRRVRSSLADGSEPDPKRDEKEVKDLGVRSALSLLKFYKREISPLLLPSCRYVPTCSEYSMEAYKRYGMAKGTILTAWRLCRCNPLAAGGSGFDPPRWFGEENPSEQS